MPNILKMITLVDLVISSGKIATDTRQTPDDEWGIKYYKEDITIEDALFMVKLLQPYYIYIYEVPSENEVPSLY